MICNRCDLLIYGLTQSTETNEYLMVFQYADNGSLNKFLRKNFKDITWQTKLKLLEDISRDLYLIHYSGYIHADFHSDSQNDFLNDYTGNILQDEGISKNMKSYISDLGLSKKKDENDSEGNIYGIMPYAAPEVLSGQKFTQAADVYGFGVIMSEMSTGRRPFDGYQFDFELAVKICKGLRPEFAPGTPDCYIELAMNCMDSDPHKRPISWNVYQKVFKWNSNMISSVDASKQFLDADKIVKELPVILPQHPDHMYTSKIINTQRISSAIKATLTSIPIDSVEVPTVTNKIKIWPYI
ncbi:kinase-like domain-containing protein [Gigaspora rosea]|uniref:Kinase-like domain-containing protein n=1 Tax=Gigaspora rosea TaxID=44941 RepID=A0A397VZG1_9GLOM|nr:kinase-like domain-containing protein [Gigaspora rosea]